MQSSLVVEWVDRTTYIHTSTVFCFVPVVVVLLLSRFTFLEYFARFPLEALHSMRVIRGAVYVEKPEVIEDKKESIALESVVQSPD